jgi:hypothetical protein
LGEIPAGEICGVGTDKDEEIVLACALCSSGGFTKLDVGVGDGVFETGVEEEPLPVLSA